MTDLTGTQISSLLETLPGIAQVLRSPVADAFVGLIKAASAQAPFNPADAEEVMRYAVRRNLMSATESEKVLVEAREAMAHRPAPTVAKRKPAKAKPRRPVRKTAPKASARKNAPKSKKPRPKVQRRK